MALTYRRHWKCRTGLPVYSGRTRPGKTHHHYNFNSGEWSTCKQEIAVPSIILDDGKVA